MVVAPGENIEDTFIMVIKMMEGHDIEDDEAHLETLKSTRRILIEELS